MDQVTCLKILKNFWFDFSKVISLLKFKTNLSPRFQKKGFL